MKPGLHLKDKVFDILKQDKTFYTALRVCSNDNDNDIYNLAMCAEFKESIYKDNFTYTVVITIYKTLFGYRRHYDERVNRHYDQIVNVNDDWMNNNKLWFRKKDITDFESLFEYNSEYRDIFVLKNSTPLLTFSLNI